jgi:hypothetical protein
MTFVLAFNGIHNGIWYAFPGSIVHCYQSFSVFRCAFTGTFVCPVGIIVLVSAEILSLIVCSVQSRCSAHDVVNQVAKVEQERM